MTKAIVYKEHTLGLLRGDNILEVLRASVLKGAVGTTHEGPLNVDLGECRLATKDDFREFRVDWHPDYQLADSDS